jgi:hypothetical protein
MNGTDTLFGGGGGSASIVGAGFDSQGDLFVGTDSRVVFKVTPEGEMAVIAKAPDLNGNSGTGLAVDQANGAVWLLTLGTTGALYRYHTNGTLVSGCVCGGGGGGFSCFSSGRVHFRQGRRAAPQPTRTPTRTPRRALTHLLNLRRLLHLAGLHRQHAQSGPRHVHNHGCLWQRLRSRVHGPHNGILGRRCRRAGVQDM